MQDYFAGKLYKTPTNKSKPGQQGFFKSNAKMKTHSKNNLNNKHRASLDHNGPHYMTGVQALSPSLKFKSIENIKNRPK